MDQNNGASPASAGTAKAGDAPFRWCFIGSGKLAHIVAKQILKSGRHKIVSVFTRRLAAGEAFAKEFGARAYQSPEQAILDPEVDGVYVVTPHTSHYTYAKCALKLGKPVLCEKPVSTDTKLTEELFAIAKAKNVYFAEAMWTWFAPVAYQVQKWLSEGECGHIEKVIANYHLNSQHYSPRVTDPNLGGGALLDIGIYPLTYLYRLFGMPVKIYCKGVLDNGIDLSEEIDLAFRNGDTYRASVSICDFRGLERFIVKGTKATIKVWFFHNAKKAVLKRADGTRVRFKGNGDYLNEFDRVVTEIREKRTESLFVPPQATIDVMKIMDECRKQMGLVYPFEKRG
ncbi:MAG: Gfo/Idh/MocA family oxidoreductase [Lachnospiraceae bacterium]|nr:Gfo/Idh/MocA family oxidoreductase [Lachnospiraceae bacterium]